MTVQGALRVAEHQQARQGLLEDLARTRGLSASTFSIDEGGRGVKTATGVRAEQADTMHTRDR